MSLVWFITGASSGFGLELALKALTSGHQVIGTVRSRTKAAQQVSVIEGKGGKVIELDVTSSAIPEVWDSALKIYGHIDVLVNNAGMAYLGAVEDFTEEELHAQMDVNLYGPFKLMRAALPGFRHRNSGTIVNISSVAGLDGLPSCGAYAASKFALEGLTESLIRDLEGYNINVLIVEPGAFRTNFLGAYKVSESTAALEHYAPVKTTIDRFVNVAGKQPGDPVKGAAAIFEAVTGEGAAGPLKGQVRRLPLGPDCIKRVEEKIKNLSGDLEAARKVAESTNVE